AHCAYISIALLSAERLRGPPCSTETEFAANPEAIAMSGSDMDLWTTVTPQLPTRNSEEPALLHRNRIRGEPRGNRHERFRYGPVDNRDAPIAHSKQRGAKYFW